MTTFENKVRYIARAAARDVHADFKDHCTGEDDYEINFKTWPSDVLVTIKVGAEIKLEFSRNEINAVYARMQKEKSNTSPIWAAGSK